MKTKSVNEIPDLPSRRSFIQTGVISGVVAAVAPMSGSAATASSGDSSVDVPSFELDEITIAELQQGMESGKLTAHSIAEKYLARIEAIDKAGPALHAVIEANPDALAIADALDRERKEKGPRGPMHGIPVLIKDNIDTADGMMTTAGSLALVGAKPPKDSFVAKKLRDAGAVILGKTNLSEWANIRSSHSTSGWSGRGGLTEEPLRAEPQSLRLEFRLGCWRFGESLRGCGWYGDRRVDCVSFFSERSGWDQADGGTGEPHRDHSDFAHSGHSWADLPYGPGCGDTAHCAGGS